MSDYRKVLYSVREGVARITLNRPEKRNALDDEMIAEIRRAFAESAIDEAVRVALITGAGNDFCAGADLAAIEQLSHGTVMENVADARHLGDLFLEMRRYPRPLARRCAGEP
jgi:methylglutaconyl-CoA hydratase